MASWVMLRKFAVASFFNCACSSIGMSFKVMLAIRRNHNGTTLVMQDRFCAQNGSPQGMLQIYRQPASPGPEAYCLTTTFSTRCRSSQELLREQAFDSQC